MRGIGRLTIKKRGIAITPEELRKRLDLKGDSKPPRAHQSARARHGLAGRSVLRDHPQAQPPTTDQLLISIWISGQGFTVEILQTG
ncbi:MAG: hypothetical protein R2693_03250 [Nocardioidaceae bacterium]